MSLIFNFFIIYISWVSPGFLRDSYWLGPVSCETGREREWDQTTGTPNRSRMRHVTHHPLVFTNVNDKRRHVDKNADASSSRRPGTVQVTLINFMLDSAILSFKQNWTFILLSVLLVRLTLPPSGRTGPQHDWRSVCSFVLYLWYLIKTINISSQSQ